MYIVCVDIASILDASVHLPGGVYSSQGHTGGKSIQEFVFFCVVMTLDVPSFLLRRLPYCSSRKDCQRPPSLVGREFVIS